MPWRPLPRIAFAIATFPFEPSSPEDLPLELGDELYIIEEGGKDWSWCRGYLVAPPSILAGLTSVKGRTLEARVFSGVFPRACVAIREYLENNNGELTSKVATSTIGGSDSDTPQASDEDSEEEGSIGPDDSASQVSIEENIGNGHVRVRKRKAGLSEPEASKDLTNGTRMNATTKETPVFKTKPPAPVPMLKIGDDSPASQAEPLIDEIASSLREWHSRNLHELTLSRKYREIEKLSKLQRKLDFARRQMQTGTLTQQELKALREKTVWNLVKGNKMLGNEVIVRDPSLGGRLLTGDDDPLHVSSLQAEMSLLKKPTSMIIEEVENHHVLFEVKEANAVSKDSIFLYAALYVKEGIEPLRPITESFKIELPPSALTKGGNSNEMRTLFSDLATSDIGDTKPFGTKVYLVLKAHARMTTPPPPPPASRQTSFHETPQPNSPTSDMSSTSLKARRSLMFGAMGFGTGRGKAKTQTQISNSYSPNSTTASSTSSLANEENDARPATAKPAHYDKAVGFAVVELEATSNLSQGLDKMIVLWYPAESAIEGTEHTEMNSQVLKELFPSRTGSYTHSQHLSYLKFRIQSFQNRDSEELLRTSPVIMHDTKSSRKIGFSGVPIRPRSDIYLNISHASLPRNAMCSHPTRGAVSMEGLQNTTRLILNVEVKNEQGQSVENSIFDSSNAKGTTIWQSSATPRGSPWYETLRLSIPKDEVIDCHVVMTVGEVAEEPIGICYIPLWHEGAFITDGPHNLLFYQYDNVIGRLMGGKIAYLHLGWNPKARDNRQSWSHDMAILRVRTDLVSTLFSQNKVLLSVLNWRDQHDEDLIELLQQLRNVPDLELVKFVTNILDALFGILVQRNGNDGFEDLIFKSVVDILTIAQSKRFNLTPVIDDYTDNKFNFPFAAPCLMRSYLRLIGRRKDDSDSRQLRATLKVGRQILKFILHARKQQIQKEEYIGINNAHDEVFLREIAKLFSALEDQMRDSTPAAIGNKTLLVQHVYTWLPELLLNFGETDTAALATSFIEACSHASGKLILHKLVFIWHLVKMSREWDAELREKIEYQVESWISQYWGLNPTPDEQYREQVRLCVSIIALWNGRYGAQTISLFMKILETFHSVIKMKPEKPGTFSLLFPTSYPFPVKPTESPRDYDECLIELSALKATFRADTFASYRTEIGEHVSALILALDIDVMILQGRAFPKTWLTLHAYYHRVVMGLMQFFTELALSLGFIPSPEDSEAFNMDLWKSFLDALLVVVRSDALALEALPEQRRKAVWKIVGDLRETGAQLLSQNWHALGWPADQEEKEKYGLSRLGGYQVQYVPSLVGPIVEICLSVHEGLRMAAVEVLRSMIIAEYDLNGDISAIQIEMVQTLNELFKTKTMADTALQRLFIDQLMDGFQSPEDSEEDDDGIWHVCHNLVTVIDELLDLLVAAHAPDQHETLAIMNTIALLDFLRGMQKDDIFIEYAHQLAEIEIKDRSHQEAGLALKLHADLYRWDLTKAVDELKSPRMPAQTAFERKEELYMRMIEQFEKGSAWGPAMDCYLELAREYEHTTFNFSKLAKAQHSMARIHESIAKGEGETSRYFHVQFAGLGFPATLKNKAFIYEGFGTERLTGFHDRLQKQFPVAKLLDASDDVDVEEVEGQYIKIAVVQVHNSADQPILRRLKVPLSTKEYVLSLKPSIFSMVSKRHAGAEISEQEVEKVVFETADAFPTILRRSEVVSQRRVQLSAIESAVERVLRKTFELRHLVQRVADDVPGSLKILADAIKSQVDPVSKGSVTVYRGLLRKHQAEIQNGDEKAKNLGLALETALLDFAALLRDNIPLLEDTKHHLEYKNSSILFATTFEPELVAIANMAPAPFASGADRPFSAEASAVAVNSLSNGTSETGVLSTQAMSRTSSVNRRRMDSIAGRNASMDNNQTSHSESIDGEAPGPSVPTSRPRSKEGIANRHSFAQAERVTLVRSNSKAKAPRRQSWRAGSEDTISAVGSTPKRNTSRADKESNQAGGVGNARPQTSQSISQSVTPSVRSATGSIVKRLSTFGLGRKPSKALQRQEGVEEE